MKNKETFYRVHPDKRGIKSLLEPGQISTTWVGEVYKKCPTCNGMGDIYPDYNEEGDTCPTCKGAGEIEDVRQGVSVCRSLNDLRAYFSSRSWTRDRKTVVVALCGELSQDEDWDADEGAVLIHPTEIVRVMSLKEAGF